MTINQHIAQAAPMHAPKIQPGGGIQCVKPPSGTARPVTPPWTHSMLFHVCWKLRTMPLCALLGQLQKHHYLCIMPPHCPDTQSHGVGAAAATTHSLPQDWDS